MKKQPNAVVTALRKAAKGLVYTSETDAKLEPFLWQETGELDNKRLLQLADAEEDAPVEQESLDDFFHAVPPEDVTQFDKLAKVLKEQLSGVKVYKIGEEAEKQAYIVGKTTDGQWAGLKTTVVET